jgi:hypothetical protein
MRPWSTSAIGASDAFGVPAGGSIISYASGDGDDDDDDDDDDAESHREVPKIPPATPRHRRPRVAPASALAILPGPLAAMVPRVPELGGRGKKRRGRGGRPPRARGSEAKRRARIRW